MNQRVSGRIIFSNIITSTYIRHVAHVLNSIRVYCQIADILVVPCAKSI